MVYMLTKQVLHTVWLNRLVAMCNLPSHPHNQTGYMSQASCLLLCAIHHTVKQSFYAIVVM